MGQHEAVHGRLRKQRRAFDARVREFLIPVIRFPPANNDKRTSSGRCVHQLSPRVGDAVVKPIIVVVGKGAAPSKNDIVNSSTIQKTNGVCGTRIGKMHISSVCIKSYRGPKIHDLYPAILLVPDPDTYFLDVSIDHRLIVQTGILSNVDFRKYKTG